MGPAIRALVVVVCIASCALGCGRGQPPAPDLKTPNGKTPDAKKGGDDGPARSQGPTVLQGHTDEVASLAFSPDGKTLASGGWDKAVILWDVAAAKPRTTFKDAHTQKVMCVAFSTDGKVLATAAGDLTGEKGEVKLWDAVAGKEQMTLPGLEKSASAVAFSSDGKTLATASHGETVTLWDFAAGKPRDTLKTGFGVATLAFAPDGKTLAVGMEIFEKEKLRLWDVAALKEKAILKGVHGKVACLAFSPDGSLLASGEFGGKLKVWDVAGTQEKFDLKGHGIAVGGVAFAPKDKVLASGDYLGKLIMWDATSGKELASHQAHLSGIRTLAFSPDGTTLATAGLDAGEPSTQIKLWDVKTLLEKK